MTCRQGAEGLHRHSALTDVEYDSEGSESSIARDQVNNKELAGRQIVARFATFGSGVGRLHLDFWPLGLWKLLWKLIMETDVPVRREPSGSP